jgi:hypothetical protein
MYQAKLPPESVGTQSQVDAGRISAAEQQAVLCEKAVTLGGFFELAVCITYFQFSEACMVHARHIA